MSWEPKTFECRICGHKWQETQQRDERDILVAAKTNKQGPVCVLCRHLTMALRIAHWRKVGIETALSRVVVAEYPEIVTEGSADSTPS